jgi:SAM-dependent methyltransferase
MLSVSIGGKKADIRLPRSALRYALLQRPMLQRFTGLSRRLGIPPSLLLLANAALRRRAVTSSYSRMIRADFEMIRPHLPSSASHILDIGCGIAGLDVVLFRHYRHSPGLKITLLDRTDPHTIPRYGFMRTMEFYNVLEVSSAVLRRNGVPAVVFQALDAAAEGAFPEGPLDLVMSLASWGFHYPLSTYMEQVHRALAPGGRLILDVRRDQGQEQELAHRFADLECIDLTWNNKACRYRATKHE